MTPNKTQATDASVAAYLAARGSPAQQLDCAQLMRLLQQATGEPARMWGPSIVGYGRYHYRYDSGREGEACRVGFAIRKAELVLYLVADSPEQAALLARLGKHKMGKACLYFKRLADLDPAVLGQLVAGSLAALKRQHG